VVRSTPGNNLSTDSAIPNALSLPSGIRGWEGSYIPRALGCLFATRSCSLSGLSWASWRSNSVILVSVELFCVGCVPWMGLGGT